MIGIGPATIDIAGLVLGIVRSMIAAVVSMTAAEYAMIWFVKTMFGAGNAMIWFIIAMLGVGHAMIGLDKTMSGTRSVVIDISKLTTLERAVADAVVGTRPGPIRVPWRCAEPLNSARQPFNAGPQRVAALLPVTP